MNIKSAIMTGVVVFIALFGLDFLIHGVWLKEIYQQTAAIWRSEAEMKNHMVYMTASQIIFSMVFALLFARCYEAGRPPLGQGLRFGLWVGFLLSPAMALTWYSILPIPGMLAVYWFVGCFTSKIVLGLTASLVYKP